MGFKARTPAPAANEDLNVQDAVSKEGYKPLMPHGELREVFPDIFVVTGTSRPSFMGRKWQFSRNMTVVRRDQELTLINTVRLDDQELAKLDALGKVAHVVRIGAFHGMDDGFYVDRYPEAKLWALEGAEHESGHVADKTLTVVGDMPFADCSLFVFETSSQPEGVLHIDAHGGVLVSCDSLQNWVEPDRFFDDESAELMSAQGFFQKANIGPGWLHACAPQASDFERIKALSFQHLISAHGEPLRDTAHADLSATFADKFDAQPPE